MQEYAHLANETKIDGNYFHYLGYMFKGIGTGIVHYGTLGVVGGSGSGVANVGKTTAKGLLAKLGIGAAKNKAKQSVIMSPAEYAARQRVFWSGEKAGDAAKYALKNNRVTLEMTRIGNNWGKTTQGIANWTEAKPMWSQLSETFAKGIPDGSTIYVFLDNPISNGIWSITEKEVLRGKGVTFIEHIIK